MIPSFRKFQDDMNRARDLRNERLRRKRAKANRRSFLEQLEDRRLMAVFTVSNEAELRQAISDANNNKEADAIQLAGASITITGPQLELKADQNPDNAAERYKTRILGPGTINVGNSPLLVGRRAEAEFVGLEITGAKHGAIEVSGHLLIRDSTLHGNKADHGLNSDLNLGGVITTVRGSVMVVNSTISDNPGAVALRFGPVSGGTVINSTITNNLYGIHGKNSGGIFYQDPGRVTLYNSIVAGNSFEDVRLENSLSNSIGLDSSHNLVGVVNIPNTVLKTGSNNNIEGVAVSTVIDTTLKRKGGGNAFTGPGEILTHALVEGSPAIDAGNSERFTFEPKLDQRGSSRFEGSSIDIGPLESQGLVASVNRVVSVTNELDYDPRGANPQVIEGSLRWAIEQVANKNADADTIVFAPNVKVIVIKDVPLELTETGLQNKTTIQGPVKIVPQNVSLVVKRGVFAEFFALEIADATLGAIETHGHLEIHSSTLHNNNNSGVDKGIGGAVTAVEGQLVVVNSTFHNNTANVELRNQSGDDVGSAGAVWIASGEVEIVNSAFIQGDGRGTGPGGKFSGAIFTHPDAKSITVNNSIFGFNQFNAQNGDTINIGAADLVGKPATGRNNIVDDRNPAASAVGLEIGKNGNMALDYRLAIEDVLTANDKGILTHRVKDTSDNPAIDKGDTRWFHSSRFTDQLGAPRVSGEGVDIGPVEKSQPQGENPIFEFEGLRFVTTGTFTTDAKGIHSSKGSIDIGLIPTADHPSFEPLLHFRRGIQIVPTGANGPFLTTDGIIAAATQGKVVNLMSGAKKTDAAPQQIQIPIRDLRSTDGYAISSDDALEWRVSSTKRFQASTLAMRDDGNGNTHLEMSGFLSLDALNGAGFELKEILDSRKTITGVSKANPAVVTAPGHGFIAGDRVQIQQINGMTEINDKIFIVDQVTNDTFTLQTLEGFPPQHIDSTSFAPYSSGGVVTKKNYVELTQDTVTAIIHSGDLTPRSASNKPLSEKQPLTLTAGGAEYDFPQAKMTYDRETSEIKLSGQTRVSYEAGHAEMQFGLDGDDSFLYVKDGELELNRTKSARFSEFTVAFVKFERTGSNPATVKLNLAEGILKFNQGDNKATFKGSTSDEIPTATTESKQSKVIGFVPGKKRNAAQLKECETQCSYDKALGDQEVYFGTLGPYTPAGVGPFTEKQQKERKEEAERREEEEKRKLRAAGFLIFEDMLPADKERIQYDTVELKADEIGKIGEEKDALTGVRGEEVKFDDVEVEWTLTKGLVEKFSFPVNKFEFGTMKIENEPGSDEDSKMKVEFDPESFFDTRDSDNRRVTRRVGPRYSIRGGGQILTHERDGKTVAKLNVGLDKLTFSSGAFNTEVVKGDGVIINNGRVDAFDVPVGKLTIYNEKDPASLEDKDRTPKLEFARTDSGDRNYRLRAHYNPSSKELRMTGNAQLQEGTRQVNVDFGRAEDFKKAVETPVDSDCDFHDLECAGRTVIGRYDFANTNVRDSFSLSGVRATFAASESEARSGRFLVAIYPFNVAPQLPLTVTYELGGTATPGHDYTIPGSAVSDTEPLTRSQRVASLQQRSFLIEVKGIADDIFIENDETVTVTLKSIKDSSGTDFPVDETTRSLVIADNDTPHTIFSSENSGRDRFAYVFVALENEVEYNSVTGSQHTPFVTTVTSEGFLHQGTGGEWLYRHRDFDPVSVNVKVDDKGDPILDDDIIPTFIVNANDSKDFFFVDGLRLAASGLVLDSSGNEWQLQQPDDALVSVNIDGLPVPVKLPTDFRYNRKEHDTWRMGSSSYVLRVEDGLFLGGMEFLDSNGMSPAKGQISLPDKIRIQRPTPPFPFTSDGFTYTSDGPVTLKLGDTLLKAKQISLPLQLDVNGHLKLAHGAEIKFDKDQTVQGITFTEELTASYIAPTAEEAGYFALMGKGIQKAEKDGNPVSKEVTIGGPGADARNMRISNGVLTGQGILPDAITAAGLVFSTKGLTRTPSVTAGDGASGEGGDITYTGTIELEIGGITVELELGGIAEVGKVKEVQGKNGNKSKETTFETTTTAGLVLDGNGEVKEIHGSFSLTDTSEPCTKGDRNCKRSALTFGGVKISPSGELTWKAEHDEEDDEGNPVLDEDGTTKRVPETLTISGAADLEFEAKEGLDPVNFGVDLTIEIQEGEISKVEAGFTNDKAIELFGMELLISSGGFSYDFNEEQFEAHGSLSLTTGMGDATNKKGEKKSTFFKGIDFSLGSPDSPGLVIKEGKLEQLSLSLSAEVGFDLFDVAAKAEDLSITYSRSDSELTLTGGLEVTVGAVGGFDGLTGRVALPGKGLLINTTTGQVELRGLELAASADFGGMSVSAAFRYERDDEGVTTISGEGEVTLPGGLTVGAGFELIDGDLNAISLKLSKENPGIQIGNTGVFLTSIEGEISGISDPDRLKVRVKVTGSLGPTISIFGETASLVTVSGELTFFKGINDEGKKETSLALTGTVSVLDGWVGEAEGTVKIYFESETGEFITIDANMRLLPGGIFQGEVEFKLDRKLNMTFRSELAVVVPDVIPIVGGEKLGSFQVYMQIRPNDDDRRNDYATVNAELDLKILEGRARITANFAGELFGFAEGELDLGFYSIKKSKRFNLQIPGTGERDLVFLVPDAQDQLDGLNSDHDVAEPALMIGDVMLDPDGPGGTVHFTGISHLPDTTTIELFVDTDGSGHNGHLLASGLALLEGQQTYHWSDLVAFSSVPYDANEKLYVYGRIYDGSNIPVDSNYSTAITPPDFSPTISLPGAHSFGTNQALVFSSSQQNAISFGDPLADHDADVQLVVTLDVNHGNLTLDPQQATPWTNINNATDVDGSGGTQVSDALHLISMLNDPALQAAGGQLPSQRSTVGGTPMYDVNGDGKITAADAAALTDPLLNPETGTTSDFVAPQLIIEGDGTGRLQLIGTAAEINRMLDGLTYQSFDNAFFDDRLEVTVNRFPEFSFNVHTDSIPLTARGLTVGSPDGFDFLPVSYEQGSEAHLLGGVRIASAASGHIQSAMIQIDGFDPEKDVLGLARHAQNSLGIKAAFDSTTGTLYLTGSNFVQNYQRAIALTTFNSHGTGQRTLRVHLGDRSSNVANTSVAVHIIAMNQAPMATTGLGSTYVSGSTAAVTLLPSATVQDADSPTLRQAVITLDADSYHQGEDVLTYEVADNITGRFNAMTGQLVLSGEASPAAWSAALSRVKYINTQATATPGIRKINITVDDGNAMNSTGNAHQRLLVLEASTSLQSTAVGNLPTETATKVNRDGSITLAPDLTLTAGIDEIDSLVRVDVAFTENFMPGNDFLGTGGLLVGMGSSYDAMNGVLTITGDVPVDFYEYVLQRVNYSNRSLVHDGLAREITFTVHDGFTSSDILSMSAQHKALPVVQSGMELLVYENGKSTHPLDANINVMYAGDTLTGATVKFVWDYLGDQDRLLFTNQNGIVGNFDETTGVLKLTGTATVQQYQDALRSITYTNTRTNPLAGLKQLDVFVRDGNSFSDPIHLLMVVATDVVAPEVIATTTEVGFTEGNEPVVVAPDITIGQRDESHESGRGAVFVTSAEVFIDGYVPGEDVLSFDAFESEPDENGDTVVIDGGFNVENGVLSIRGRATPDQYEAVLRGVRYENVSAAPSTHSRELLIAIAQGITFSDAPPITVTVTSLNDPPTRIVAPPASATILKNAIFGSLGLEEIDYAPPHEQQPFVVVTVTAIPDAALGLIELSNETGFAIATVGGLYTLEEIRSAVFIPALNAAGTGTLEFTVAGWNPILEQPDPAHLTESVRVEVAGVEGLGITTTVYDFDHLADGPLAGQDGWVRVSAGGTMTVASGVVSAAGDGQQMRPTDFGLSGNHVTVTAQLTTRNINGWQFGILHSGGTGVASDFVFAVGNLGSNWRLRGAGFNSDRTAAGTGAAEITATVESYEVRLEIDLAAPSGSGAAQLFVNDVLVIENLALGLSATSLDPATWSGIHLRHAGGATLDSLSFTGGREASPGAEFAAQAFRDLLGRNATLEELDALTVNLPFEEMSDEGVRRELVGQIQFSREYGERVVTTAFQRLLKRAPTAQEIDEVFDPNAPIPLDAINNLIIGGEEYFTNRGGETNEGFVQAAFADLLDREPTAQELGDAVPGLQTGNISRADIAGQIEHSEEGAAIVAAQLIGNLLRRTAARAEIEELAGLIQDGREVALNAVVSAEEYYVRYGVQTSANSRSDDEITAHEAKLIRQWLEGTPTSSNSQITNDFDAVGTINTDGRAHAGGTLIAPQYVLTAAHLVDGKDIDSLTFSVGLTSYGLHEVHIHPDYAHELLGTNDGNDIAILKLNRPVIDVQPAALWGSDLYTGDELTLVGFGPHPGDDAFGTKRAGTTPIDGLTRNLVTWTYDGADEATTVPGDSGSPQFFLDAGTYYVASLASGGTHQALSLGDFAYNTRVGAYADWIDSVTNFQVTRSVSESQGLSFTDAAVARSVFPSSFFTFNNNASVELSGDDLLVQDNSTGGEDNSFYISTTSTNVVISDAHHKLTTSITGATGSNTHTITIPLSSFTGNIVVRSAGGDDVIDATAPSRLVDIDAGGGQNSLIVNGSNADEAEEFFVRKSSTVAGSLEVAMLTATTGGPYTVRATGIAHLELNTGAGNDTVRPQNLSGLTTPLSYFGLNLGDGDDMLDGTNGTISMVADGGDGNDSLVGGTANDRLSGGFGDDSLAGGPGDDTYVFDVDDFIGADTITENANKGSDTLDFSLTDFNSIGIDLRITDTPQTVAINGNLSLRLSDHIENVIGGSHGNAIIGDDGANILKGGNGLDFILGAGGADQIFGGGSVDTLQGSSDVLLGGDGADLTVFSGADIAFPTNLRPVFTIAGTAPGTGYDQVRVFGDGRTVTLGGDLEVQVNNFTPQPGEQFTIVDLQSASSVINGTFNQNGQPLNEGDTFTAGGHQFSISYVAGDGNDISLTYVERLPGAVFDVSSDGNDVVVRQGATELLRTPGSPMQRLRIKGTPGDDTYNIANLAGLVGGDADTGYDTLRLTESGQTLDLTAILDADLQGFEVIDITGTGDNSLKLSVAKVLNLSSTTNTLRVLHNEGDVVSYGGGWKVELPQIINSQFVHTLRRIKSDATDEDATIEVANTFAFQNPYLPLDVNHDGTVAPIDALIIINRLNDSGPGALGTPTSVVGLTEFFYFDANGDQAVAPIDVLVVINFLNDPTSNAEGESLVARSIPDFMVPSSGPSPAITMTQEWRQNVLPVSPEPVSPEPVSPQSVSITVRPSTASEVSRCVSGSPLTDDPTSVTEEEDLHTAMEDIFAAWPDERSGLFDTP
jgi:V8-like Glu-specific endopeptidase